MAKAIAVLEDLQKQSESSYFVLTDQTTPRHDDEKFRNSALVQILATIWLHLSTRSQLNWTVLVLRMERNNDYKVAMEWEVVRRKKESRSNKDHMEKNSGKGAWTGMVTQLGQSHGHSTRKNRLDEREGGMSKKVSQMSKHFRSLGMYLGKAQSVDHKKVTLSLYKNKLLFFWPRGEYSYFSADFRLKIFL